MVIEILGSKDPQTNKLLDNLKSALQKLQAFAKIRLVTDHKKISSYGPMMLPALLIDGVIKVTGRVPRVDEIAQIIKTAARR